MAAAGIGDSLAALEPFVGEWNLVAAFKERIDGGARCAIVRRRIVDAERRGERRSRL